MVKTEVLFSDELRSLVLSKNRFTTVLQSFQEDDARITNSVLYQTNLIDDSELLELPESQMRLYVFLNRYDSIPFETEAELVEYVRNSQEPFLNVCVVDYLGDFSERDNVVKITYLDGKYAICAAREDEVGFGLYHDVLNLQESRDNGEPVWDVDSWGLKTIYAAFRRKGIIPEENDPHTKIIRMNCTLDSISSGSGVR